MTSQSGSDCRKGALNDGDGAEDCGRSSGIVAYFARTSRNAQYFSVGFPASSSGAS
jgi:hypothetical protein